MQAKTSIKDLADLANLNVKTALTQIKGQFGDSYPDVHKWTSETLLPDEPLGSQILDFLGLQNGQVDAIAVLDRAEITTIEGKLLDATQAREYALSALSEVLKTSIADYLQATLSEAVINGYNEAQDQAYELLADIAGNDIDYLQKATQSAMERLSNGVGEGQKKGDLLRSRIAKLQTSGQTFSKSTRNHWASIKQSIEKKA